MLGTLTGYVVGWVWCAGIMAGSLGVLIICVALALAFYLVKAWVLR